MGQALYDVVGNVSLGEHGGLGDAELRVTERLLTVLLEAAMHRFIDGTSVIPAVVVKTDRNAWASVMEVKPGEA